MKLNDIGLPLPVSVDTCCAKWDQNGDLLTRLVILGITRKEPGELEDFRFCPYCGVRLEGTSDETE